MGNDMLIMGMSEQKSGLQTTGKKISVANLKVKTGKPVDMEEQAKLNGQTIGDITAADPVMTVRNCDVYYGDNHALQSIDLDIGRSEV
ncbi:MAG: hypothetical protein ACC631_06665, partial [Halocynthiibacter sp.]